MTTRTIVSSGSTRTLLGSWEELGLAAGTVRTEVFVHEQGIAPELEWDELDAVSTHAVVFDVNDKPIGTGRLIAPAGAKQGGENKSSSHAKIGRMAVLKAHRRVGVGDDVLKALLLEASHLGYSTIELSAQSYVASFYAAHGFEAVGDEYLEVGISHQKMVLKLI